MDFIHDWVVGLMKAIGAPGVGVATALETVFPPIPSEVVLPLAGFTASEGHYSVLSAVVWATVGSLVGALVLYWAGAAWGHERIARLADRIPLFGRRDVDRSVEWFAGHGKRAVFFGRFVPGIRSLVSIPAGVQRMPLVPFVLWTTLGSAIWNGALIGAGYLLADQWHVVEQYVGGASNVVYVLLVLVVVAFVAVRVRNRVTESNG